MRPICKYSTECFINVSHCFTIAHLMPAIGQTQRHRKFPLSALGHVKPHEYLHFSQNSLGSSDCNKGYRIYSGNIVNISLFDNYLSRPGLE